MVLVLEPPFTASLQNTRRKPEWIIVQMIALRLAEEGVVSNHRIHCQSIRAPNHLNATRLEDESDGECFNKLPLTLRCVRRYLCQTSTVLGKDLSRLLWKAALYHTVISEQHVPLRLSIFRWCIFRTWKKAKQKKLSVKNTAFPSKNHRRREAILRHVNKPFDSTLFFSWFSQTKQGWESQGKERSTCWSRLCWHNNDQMSDKVSDNE